MLQSSFANARFASTQLVRSPSRSPVCISAVPVGPAPPRASAATGLESSAGSTPSSPFVIGDRSNEVRRRCYALNSRLVNRTHPNTVDMSTAVDAQPAANRLQLPVSQLAFKALLRASLAAARLQHGCVTTPHILLGLISAAAACPQPAQNDDSSSSSSSSSHSVSHPLAAAGGCYADAESAVTALIDGPAATSSAAAAAVGAAGVLLGRSEGLEVVSWCGELSLPAQAVLRNAEHLRQQHGHPLLTTSHILSALLAAGPGQQQQQWAAKLLSQLGLDAAAVAAAAAAAAAAPVQQQGEDGQQCEPVGFLHEEFALNLRRALSPAAPGPATCLN